MSTITPSRPSSPSPAAPRPRPPSPPAPARAIDPFRVLRRHWLLIAATGFGGVVLGVAAFIVLGRISPLYSGEVLFEIRSGLNEARDIASRDITQDDLVLRLATTEAALLTSREVLRSACLQDDVQRTAWFRREFTDENGTALIEEAVDELIEDIDHHLVRGSNLFGLRWTTRVDNDVPIVLNAIGDAYIAKRKEQDDKQYNENLDLFNTELSNTNRDLDDLDAEIQQFIRAKGITTLESTRSNHLALAVEDIEERLNGLKSTLSYAQSQYLQIAAKLEGTVEPTDEDRHDAEEDPAVRAHEVAVLEAKTSLRQLRERYRAPDFWMIELQESRLRALELEYEAKIDQIMTANLQSQLEELGGEIESYRSLIEELEGEFEEKEAQLRTLAADMATYGAMEDRREHLQATRDIDLDLIKELRLMRLRADASRVALAQRAQTPRVRSFPDIKVVVPLTAFLVVGLVVGLIFLRELTDQRVRTPADLNLLPHARVLGIIPELDEDPCRSEAAELVVRRCPNSVLAESYRAACTLMSKAMSRAGHQSLLLVGGLPSAGTTTAATNLASAAAAAGRRVVVVDGNFRRPSLAEAFGLDPDRPGLGDALADGLGAPEVVTGTDYGVDVVTAGRPGKRVFERLDSARFDELIAELRQRYDLILVDSPPAVVAGDALALAGRLDAAVLVVRANREQRGLVARLVGQLTDAQCELLGILLNRPRGTAGGYFKKNFATMARYAATNGA